MIVMGWRRTSYTTKVLLTIKPLWPPDSPFLHSSPLVIPFGIAGQKGRFLVSLDTTTRLTAKSVGAYNVVLRYGKVRKLWRGSKKPRMKGR
jgi:hypothetical protein